MTNVAAVPTSPLVIALQMCQSLGDTGRLIWELGKLYVDAEKRRKHVYTPKQRLDYLKMAIASARSRMTEAAAFKEATGLDMWERLPADFQTFVDSPELMNKTGTLWPEVLAAGLEINSGRYVECILTGGIGVAKSTLAIYTQAYQTYVLSCMANPHEVFDLDTSSEILIVFQSLNKDVAKEVDYMRLRDMISNAPYFAAYFPFNKERDSDMRFPKRIIIKPVSGQDTGAIGQNVIGGILDEINFMAVVENSKQSATGGTYDQATQNYNSIASRRQSRFMQLGQLPGMLCLVSSRNYPGQFTDRKEQEAKTNPRIYVYDKRLWELRPDKFCFHKGERTPAIIEQYGADCDLTFDVFVGDATRKPRIMQPGETVPEKDRHMVMWIPIEYRTQFESNILTALREVAGVSTQALAPFITNTDAVGLCFGKCLSIVSRHECDFKDSRVLVYPRRFVNLQWPRFVHIDPSRSRDSTGLSIGHVPRFKEVDRGDVLETLPVIQFDMILEIRPPRAGEIEFANIRRLLYRLREMGLPIKWVTSDTYQSADNLQILRQQNFITGETSMDEQTQPYDALKLALYDQRVIAPEHPKAQNELVRLEFNAEKQKIDHPPNASKDLADSMAGVVYGLTMQREVWARHDIPMRAPPKMKDPPKPVPEDKGYVANLRQRRYAQ